MGYENQWYIRGLLDACGMIEKLYGNMPRPSRKTVLSLLSVMQRDYQVLKENGATLTGIRISPDNKTLNLFRT